jgi:hypothetical protein
MFMNTPRNDQIGSRSSAGRTRSKKFRKLTKNSINNVAFVARERSMLSPGTGVIACAFVVHTDPGFDRCTASGCTAPSLGKLQADVDMTYTGLEDGAVGGTSQLTHSTAFLFSDQLFDTVVAEQEFG